jgi:inner membrane protein
MIALAAVGFLDVIGSLGNWPLLLEGARDGVAHLLTAVLFLAAVLPATTERFARWVLVGAVAIDLDHVPLYAWHVGTATGSGRPVTHSLVTVIVLLALAALGRRWRTPLLGLALGVVFHFVRDVATGPGIPLTWPLSVTDIRLPYLVYVAVLVALAGGATWRRTAGRLNRG